LLRASTIRDLDMGWQSLTQVEQDTAANKESYLVA
jgi:hypothetical protein